MRRNKAECIGDIIRQYLRQEGLETPLNETRMAAAWSEVMGQAIARYTGDVFVKKSGVIRSFKVACSQSQSDDGTGSIGAQTE